MRVENENKSNVFLIGDYEGLLHEKVHAAIDQRPYRNILKSYSVEGVQTFTRIKKSERAPLVKQAMNSLLETYDKYEPKYVLESRTPWPPNPNDYNYKRWVDRGITGEAVELIYNHPDFGPQAVRAKILLGGNTMITQIADVSPNALKSAKVRIFLDSITMHDAVISTDLAMNDIWIPIVSPSQFFSISVPKEFSAYYAQKPLIKKTINSEVIQTTFKDPIRQQAVNYSGYGFKSDKDFTFKEVEKFIGEKFIKRHGREPSRVDFTKRIANNKPLLYFKYPIQPTVKDPTRNYVILRVYFKGPILFVQETIGHKDLVTSKFMHNVNKLHYFDP